MSVETYPNTTIRFASIKMPRKISPLPRTSKKSSLTTMARSRSDLAPHGSTLCSHVDNDRSSSIPSGSSQPQSPLPSHNQNHIGYHGRATTCDASLCQTARSSLATNATAHNSVSSRSSGSSFFRDLQLIGQCKNCEKEYKCSCCNKCHHLMIIYSPASKPRVSNITFSTVTSATGLPTIAAEPSRPRSSSYWKPQERISISENPSSSDIGQNQDSLSPKPLTPHISSSPDIKSDRFFKNNNKLAENTVVKTTTVNSATNTLATTVAHAQTCSLNVATSTSTFESPSTSSMNLNCCKSPIIKTPSPSLKVRFGIADDEIDEGISTSESMITTYKVAGGTVFDKNEIENDKIFKRVNEWSFPIFHVAEKHESTILTRMSYTIFKETNLFKIFKISYQKFFNFFHSLEMGYWDIPYHNRIHASDVLHGCYYLTCHPVKAFMNRPTTPELQFENYDIQQLSLTESMSELELMALYTAAAMHDYDHPGRTNAFLVASEDKKAILYNDRSVLENHHAAESWRLLCKKNNNFIDILDSAEIKRFRYLVLEYILATDLKQHFDIIMQFNDKANDMDLTNESDRVLISQTLIKFADINSPSKPYTLHRQWTERICQEFYEQGDEEKKRNMSVSPYMDRNEPDVAKLQDSFISHIVNPLAVALNEAGLLPILPGLEESELIINLKHNHQKWLIEIEQENKQIPTTNNAIIDTEQQQQQQMFNNHVKSMQCLPEEDTEESSNNSVISTNNNFDDKKLINGNNLTNGIFINDNHHINDNKIK